MINPDRSVNCYYCEKLFDERNTIGTTPDGGSVCEEFDCFLKWALDWSKVSEVRVWAEVEIYNVQEDLSISIPETPTCVQEGGLIECLKFVRQHQVWGGPDTPNVIKKLEEMNGS